MKDKIILFVIGVLVGAVIASGAFFIYTKTNNSNNCNIENTQMNGGTPPEMPSGENGQPPEKPDGENSENSKHSKKSSSESSASEETKEKSNSKTNESN